MEAVTAPAKSKASRPNRKRSYIKEEAQIKSTKGEPLRVDRSSPHRDRMKIKSQEREAFRFAFRVD